MNAHQFLVYIIRPALEVLGPKYTGAAAEQLLLATAAQESHCGVYVQQIDGPARGPYQEQADNLHDLYSNYLAYHPELPVKIGIEQPERLVYDFRYATQCARLQYFREPTPLPALNDVEGMWGYYKIHWNSSKGAAMRVQFLDNWHRYVAPNYRS